jgi:hypothetical protein
MLPKNWVESPVLIGRLFDASDIATAKVVKAFMVIYVSDRHAIKL